MYVCDYWRVAGESVSEVPTIRPGGRTAELLGLSTAAASPTLDTNVRYIRKRSTVPRPGSHDVGLVDFFRHPFPLLGGDRDTTVIWKEGTSYSDRLLYNSFACKTIRVFDERDPSFSVFVAVSLSQDSCPGKIRKCLVATVIVRNEGTVRFDVQPEKFEFRCNNKRQQVLSQYRIPEYLRRVAPSGALFTANTVTPDMTVKGIVFFNGTCTDYLAVVSVDLSEGRRLLFEFPMALGAH